MVVWPSPSSDMWVEPRASNVIPTTTLFYPIEKWIWSRGLRGAYRKRRCHEGAGDSKARRLTQSAGLAKWQRRGRYLRLQSDQRHRCLFVSTISPARRLHVHFQCRHLSVRAAVLSVGYTVPGNTGIQVLHWGELHQRHRTRTRQRMLLCGQAGECDKAKERMSLCRSPRFDHLPRWVAY